MEYTVKLTWDDEAAVWVATSDDIPGLVMESGSFDALLERIRYTAPGLLQLNQPTKPPVSLRFQAVRQERLAL